MAYCAINGNLYENGKINELKVGIGNDLKVQASGSGSYQVVGKLTANGAEKPLELISLSDFSTVNIATKDDMYTCDVSGMYSVSVKDVAGFTKIWATITY